MTNVKVSTSRSITMSTRMMGRGHGSCLEFVLLVLFAIAPFNDGTCHNLCSKNGMCISNNSVTVSRLDNHMLYVLIPPFRFTSAVIAIASEEPAIWMLEDTQGNLYYTVQPDRVTVCIRPDCSLRECPKGVAWSDHASGVDTAHALAECSNRGNHCFISCQLKTLK